MERLTLDDEDVRMILNSNLRTCTYYRNKARINHRHFDKV